MFEQVRKIMAQSLGIEESDIQLETRLYEDLGIDSMDLFNIIDTLEEKFHIRIAENNNINTVEDVVNLLNDLVNK